MTKIAAPCSKDQAGRHLTAGIERWLREEAVPVAAAMQAKPSRAIPAEQVFSEIRALHAERMKA